MQRKIQISLLMAIFGASLLIGCSSPGEPEELVYGGNTQSGDEDPYVPQVASGVDVGDEAPDFTLADTYGDDVVLSSLRGKPVLLYFWATGCPYCEDQHPRIQDFHETYGDSIAVISVNIGDDPQLINAYMADHELTFPCLVATSGMQADYEASSVPHAVVLDAEGLVTFNDHPGYLTENALQESF